MKKKDKKVERNEDKKKKRNLRLQRGKTQKVLL